MATVRASIVDRCCIGHGEVGVDGDHRVDRSVERRDAIEVELQEFSCRHLACVERCDQLGEW